VLPTSSSLPVFEINPCIGAPVLIPRHTGGKSDDGGHILKTEARKYRGLNYRPPRERNRLLDSGQEPPLGAHIVTPRRGYTHHGVYVGGGNVVQYRGLARSLHRGSVEEVALKQFAQGCPVRVRSRDLTKAHPFPPSSCSRWPTRSHAASASRSHATIRAWWNTKAVAPVGERLFQCGRRRGLTENEQLRISICHKLPKSRC